MNLYKTQLEIDNTLQVQKLVRSFIVKKEQSAIIMTLSIIHL